MEGIYAYIKDQRGAQSTNQPRSNASSLVIYSGAINPFAFAAPLPSPEKIWKSDLLAYSLIYTRQDILDKLHDESFDTFHCSSLFFYTYFDFVNSLIQSIIVTP